jgi:hypothetical protein
MDADNLKTLKDKFKSSSALIAFWENLAVMYQDFELSKKIKPAKVDQ